MEFSLYSFDKLDINLLYAILELRERVFVVEQNAVYTDIDYLDQRCLHVCATISDMLVGYTRLVPPGLKFAEASIGRIVLEPAHRGGGNGRKLVQHSMELVAEHFKNPPIRIEAQQHLQQFYESLGFAVDSQPYDWGGIPHLKMLAKA